ncbi:MAG: hypothetical protein WC005_00555 [Candidatus Nanopelagicales bacterium]|jgi:hypothetical protein
MMFTAAEDDAMKSVIDQAGPIALMFIVILGIALYLLWKSMNRQLKKVDENLPIDPPRVDGPTDSE